MNTGRTRLLCCVKRILTQLEQGRNLMKHFKQFLAVFIVAAVVTSNAYAVFNGYDMLANSVPQTMVFNTAQSDGNRVTLYFPSSALPAKFLCYFTENNNQQLQGISASITSENSRIDFMPGTEPTMEAGKSKVKMFTVTSTTRNKTTGSVDFTLNGDLSTLKTKAITMICSMRK